MDGFSCNTIRRMRSSCWTTKAIRICNTYYFPTATMVTRKRLNETLYGHCLSCHIQSREWVMVLYSLVWYELYCLKTYLPYQSIYIAYWNRVAQSLQLLGYVVCNRGPRARFSLCKTLLYTLCRPALESTKAPTNLVSGALSIGVNWPGLEPYS
jgi:hypothetical protein